MSAGGRRRPQAAATAGWLALLLLGAPAAGCGDVERSGRAEPADAEPAPSATVDEPGPSATVDEPVPSATVDEPAPAEVDEEPAPDTAMAVPTPAAGPLPGAVVPRSVDRRAVRQVRRGRAELVTGAVEIELKGGRSVPGERLYVVLRQGRERFEAFTDRGGVYYMENVPAGAWERMVSVGKGAPILTDTVTVEAGARVRLEPLRIRAVDIERVPRAY